MQWLCMYFSHLAIELRESADQDPVAITDRQGSRRILIDCNQSARASGLTSGTDAAAALAREPQLRLIERSLEGEKRALKALANWAYQFSSDVSIDATRWLLWIEIGASVRYFAGLDELHSRIRAGETQLGYTSWHGIAPTFEAAALLARRQSEHHIRDLASIASVVAPFPLSDLALSGAAIDALHASGLRTVADLASIPVASLARRFGPECTDYLGRLLGTRPDLRRRHRPPESYRRRFECGYPIETVEGLKFPLRRVLQELQGYLRGRDTALQVLLVTFRHRDAPDTVLTVRTTNPQRDALSLFALLSETLERTQLVAPVAEIIVAADEFAPPTIVQTDLFDDGRRHDAGWTALLDKLRARLSERAVRRLGLQDDHRPEKAWCIQGPEEMCEPTEAFPERPLWILQPQPIATLPKILGTSERIESGWWHGEDSSRDYYLAHSPKALVGGSTAKQAHTGGFSMASGDERTHELRGTSVLFQFQLPARRVPLPRAHSPRERARVRRDRAD